MNASFTDSSLNITDEWLIACTHSIVIGNQIVNLVLGFPLNSYIIFLLSSGGLGMDMFTAFMVNQSAAEICLALAAPLSILCHVNIDLCYAKPLGFFWGISMTARTIFQCCICMERYLAVVQPVTFLRYNRRRYRVFCSVANWTISLAFSILCIFTFPGLPYSFLGVIYGLVLFLDLFCCLSILKVLRRARPGKIKNESESDDAGMNTVKRRAFAIVVINLMTLLLQTIPICATFILHKHFFSLEAFNLAVAICLLVNFLAGFVHPLFFMQKVHKLTLCRCF